jgi:small GTP-binding protein
VQNKIVKKICLLGDSSVGKTSLIRKFVHDVFDDKYIATIGTKTSKKEIQITYMGKQTNLVLVIWDVLGQKEYRGVHTMSFRGTSGALVVCDVTRPDTLGSLEGYWAPELEKVAGKVPLVFMGNKCDMVSEAKIGVKEMTEVAFAFDSPCYLTSAKTGENIEHAFKALAIALLSQKVRPEKAPQSKVLTPAQAFDEIMVHFCESYGQDQEFAMAVVRKQSIAAGLDVRRPSTEQLIKFVDGLAEAEKEFKGPAEATSNKAHRRALIERIHNGG